MKDLMNVIDVKRVISPVSVSDNTAQAGQAVDRKGYDSVTYIIATGSIADADATFTVLLEESDASGSGYTAVSDDDLIGTEVLAAFQFDDDNECRKLGYKGTKRYVQLSAVQTGTTSVGCISATALLFNPNLAPVSNP